MNQVKVPIPPYAVTDGSYWPNGLGTIPLPINLPDDGRTYIVITIANASAGDSLDTLVFNGADLLGGSVPMVAGDDDQSADDIVTQITANTSGSLAGEFTGTAAAGGMVVIYRDDTSSGLWSGFSFTATTANGTIISVVPTKWVLEEAGTYPDGIYYIKNALDPGVLTVEPEPPVANPNIRTPPVGPTVFWSPVSLAPELWLYVPSTHTLHKIVWLQVTGGAPLSATFGTHNMVLLDPPLPITIAGTVPFMVMPSSIAAPFIENTGGAAGLVNGVNFPTGQVFDRSHFPQTLGRPLTYDSMGTQYTIITNP